MKNNLLFKIGCLIVFIIGIVLVSINLYLYNFGINPHQGSIDITNKELIIAILFFVNGVLLIFFGFYGLIGINSLKEFGIELRKDLIGYKREIIVCLLIPFIFFSLCVLTNVAIHNNILVREFFRWKGF